MIGILIKSMIQQLNNYILSTEVAAPNNSGDLVKLGNIANAKALGGEDSALNGKVIVSLVNIQEENTLRNKSNIKIENGQYLNTYPTLYLNLDILFTANFDVYDTAIQHLCRVLEFFQGNKVFKFNNAPSHGLDATAIRNLEEIELSAELCSLSYEQINDLWGSLGGKQMPFALYRFRLVPVQMEKIKTREGIITETELILK